MRSGFIYKNKRASDFGAVAKTKSRPVLPEMKSTLYNTLLDDGAYDFSAANEYGRAFYNDRFFETELTVTADSLRELEKKVSKIAVWLQGSGELIFDDLPNSVWHARVMSELGFMPELHGKKTVMTVVFRVEPFAESVFDTVDGAVLDTSLEICENIPLDLPARFKWQFSAGSSFSYITKAIKVLNIGSAYQRPVIRFSGDIKSVAVGNGKQTLTVDSQTNEIVIDFSRQLVTDAAGESLMTKVSGEFFELKPYAASSLAVVIYAKGTVTVTAEYTPKLVYDLDLDETDWSESNA